MIELIKNHTLIKGDAFIAGEWLAGPTRFKVRNPYDQTMLAEVTDTDLKMVRTAIASAAKAFLSWRALTANQRSTILKRWYQLQIENLEDLALLLTLEQGKPLAEARGEIKYGAGFVEWFAEEAPRAYGDVIPGHGPDKRITVIKQPVGVVGAITPWNFPNAMITRKVAPALAAGCTVVIKPSELTPLSALALAELARQAGFPAGVLNVVPTLNAPLVGDELTSNRLVRKISFTGSTAVGKLLLEKSAKQVKKVTLELGGNAPFIVFDDADIGKAVAGAIASKFRNAGQTCICANRIFVHAPVYDQFIEQFSRAAAALKIGQGTNPITEVGPLIEDKALSFVKDIVSDAISHGGIVMTGGKSDPNVALLYQPTVIKNVDQKMRVFTDEIFGPIAPVFRFETEDEVVRLANNTSYGLAAYFYGRDYARLWRVAEALEYGMVGINTGMISTPVAPFGGVKESGIGREGSRYGMDDYLNIKYMCWGGVE